MKKYMLGIMSGIGGLYIYTKYKDGTFKRTILNIKPKVKNMIKNPLN